MSQLKAAVVGVGHLGKHHARWYSNLPGCDLVGLYDVDVERAASVAKDLNVPVFKSLDELIKAADICSVVTSTAKHFEVGEKLLQGGIHCLIEKPIAATLEQAEKLLSLAEKMGCLLTVGHIERFNPAFLAIQKFHPQPKFIESHRLTAFNPRGADVAVVLDLMIHDIDLCLALSPGAKVLKIDASAVNVVSETADIANARIAFDNGCIANLTASRISLNAMRKFRIFQNEAYFSLDLAERKADFYRLDKDGSVDSKMKIPIGESGKSIAYEKIDAAGEDQLSKELQTFILAASGKGKLEVTGDQGLEALKIALQIEKIAGEA